MSVEINKNQVVNKTMRDYIISEGLDAFRFLPTEDKVNMMLKAVSLPVIDDSASMGQVLANAQGAIADLEASVAALTAENDDLKAASGG